MSRRGIAQGQPALTPYLASSGPVGVTLVSPQYAHLASPAVERFQRHTGLEVLTINVPEENAFAAKLNLDLLVAARPIVYFDADWWMLREYPFDRLANLGKWCAVVDPGARHEGIFPQVDCEREGWDPATYFNSGLFCCDLRQAEVKAVFKLARRRLRDCHAGLCAAPADWTDQFWLNWAVRQVPGLFRELPWGVNYYRHAVDSGHATIPSAVIGLHAAGFSLPEKLGALEFQESVHSPK